jgi:hypothetical protein
MRLTSRRLRHSHEGNQRRLAPLPPNKAQTEGSASRVQCTERDSDDGVTDDGRWTRRKAFGGEDQRIQSVLVENGIDTVRRADREVFCAGRKVFGRVRAGCTERGDHGLLTAFSRRKLDIRIGVVEIDHVFQSPDLARDQLAHVRAKVDLEVVLKYDRLAVRFEVVLEGW